LCVYIAILTLRLSLFVIQSVKGGPSTADASAKRGSGGSDRCVCTLFPKTHWRQRQLMYPFCFQLRLANNVPHSVGRLRGMAGLPLLVTIIEPDTLQACKLICGIVALLQTSLISVLASVKSHSAFALSGLFCRSADGFVLSICVVLFSAGFCSSDLRVSASPDGSPSRCPKLHYTLQWYREYSNARQIAFGVYHWPNHVLYKHCCPLATRHHSTECLFHLPRSRESSSAFTIHNDGYCLA
jgi:hypothetical protein